METIEVRLDADHLRRVTMTTPVKAVAELIWNALDADATLVTIEITENAMGVPELLRVTDNGHGMSPDRARTEFGKLGGSWKAEAGRSQERRRILHGKLGEGRFKAFAIGDRVEWQTRTEADPRVTITGALASLAKFEVTETEDVEDSLVGTTVTVLELNDKAPQLVSEQVFVQLCGEFGPYVRRYPGVRIHVMGREVDPDALVVKDVEVPITGIRLSGGEEVDVSLQILEWSSAIEQRSLYLCDKDGFTLERLPGNMPRLGINFSAHARSEYFDAMAKVGALSLHELSPDLQTVISAVRGELRRHLRKRHAEMTRDRVHEWKQENIYPYEDAPQSASEEAERQVFDIVAVQVADYLPDFEKAAPAARKFQFALLKQALKENPAALKRILTEVINLPAESQSELADLLEYTSLGNMIRASKVVADRIAFLRLLERLLYEKKPRKALKERSQLHRVLAAEPWIFGEQYSLVVDDKGLSEVLRVHAKQIGKEIDLSHEPKDLDGKRAVVDLVLQAGSAELGLGSEEPEGQPASEDEEGADQIIAKTLKRETSASIENLVVELKRPSQRIDEDALAQVKRYALAIAADERFDKESTTWTFIAVSNALSPGVAAEGRQRDRARGLVMDTENIKIWVKTWAEILGPALARLQFFQNHLDIVGVDDAAMELLRAKHSAYISPEILDDAVA